MDRADPGRTQPRFEAEIEIGRVDADEEVGGLIEQQAPELAPDREDLGNVLERLDVAAHGELLEREERTSAFTDHLRARDAVEIEVGHALAQRADERRAEHVAGSFPGDDRHPLQRRMPRVAVSRNATSGRTSFASSACRASSALASARLRPDL